MEHGREKPSLTLIKVVMLMMEQTDHVSLDPSCSKEVFSLRNLPAARFHKGPVAACGIERIFCGGENFFRIFLNALQVLAYFLDVF